MMVTYGHQVNSVDDEFVALAEAVRKNDKEAPGSAIVDLIPICKSGHFICTLCVNNEKTSEVRSGVVSRRRVSAHSAVCSPARLEYALRSFRSAQGPAGERVEPQSHRYHRL